MQSYHDEISESDYTEHNVIVYPDIVTFAEIYSHHAKEAIEKKNDIVLIATTYQTIDAVKAQLENKGVNASKYINDGSLVIIDSAKGYNPADVQGTMKFIKSLLIRVKKEGKNGITNFSDLGSFFLFEKVKELIEYEQSIPKKMDIKLRGFCCYHQANFHVLTKEQQETILEQHNKSILMTSA
jgi:hypothetical protein